MAWAPLYADEEEFRSYLRIPVDDESPGAVDSAELLLALEAASRAVDHRTGRQFGKVATVEARDYTIAWDRQRARYVVGIDDVMTTTGLLIALDNGDGTYSGSSLIADCRLLPVNAAQKGRPWEALLLPSGAYVSALEGSVRITASWGWSAVPEPVKQATLMQASRFLARRDAPFGVAGSPEMGNEIRLLAKLDPDVAVTVRPYIRWWGAR